MRVNKICGHTLVGTRVVRLVRPSTRVAYVFDTLRKKMMKIIKNDYGSINNARFTTSDKRRWVINHD